MKKRMHSVTPLSIKFIDKIGNKLYIFAVTK